MMRLTCAETLRRLIVWTTTWALFSSPSSILIRNDDDGDDDEETRLWRHEGGAVKPGDKDTRRSLARSLALRSTKLSAVDIVIKCRKVYYGDFAPPWRVWVADEFIVSACRVPFSSRRGFCRALAILIGFSERGESSIPVH